ETGWDTDQPGSREVSAFAWPVLVVLAGVAAVLGVLGLPVVAESMRGLLGAGPAATPMAWELALAAAVAVGAAALVWWWGDRPVPVAAALGRWLAAWLGFERAATVLVVRPTMALARALAAFDDRILDRAVRAVPALGLRLAKL